MPAIVMHHHEVIDMKNGPFAGKTPDEKKTILNALLKHFMTGVMNAKTANLVAEISEALKALERQSLIA